MGQNMSNERIMLALMSRHGSPILKQDHKSLLQWMSHMFPNTTPSIFTLHYWDKVSVKLYDLAVLPDHEAEIRMAPAWRAVMDVIEEEGGSGAACGAAAGMALVATPDQNQPMSCSLPCALPTEHQG